MKFIPAPVSTAVRFLVVILLAIVVTGLAYAPSAFAVGFSCLSVDRNERMDLFFNSLEDGSPATKLIILDPNLSKRSQHIATFDAEKGLLKTRGRKVLAFVDPSVPESSRKGERVGGTTLGSLQTIELEIQVTETLTPGATFAAQATYRKLIGEVLTQDFDCILFGEQTAPEELRF